MSDDRTILLQLVASLTLCDHMGDVADAVITALKRAGILARWDDLRAVLSEMGVTTLHGTELTNT